MQTISTGIVRYSLVLVLAWLGAMKFFTYEAEGIESLVANSPLMSWLYRFLSVQGLSNLLGVIEIGLAALIALWWLMPRISALASAGAVAMFLITLSFMITTPDVWQPGYGFPFLGAGAAFLIKDAVLLGAAAVTAAESFTRARAPIPSTGPR
ncbi:YkgB family protein [Nocardia mexicana]|uniref:YkgB family protein n=1 Tax=Nocardia mexicana TaxID=279262 RepID=UPI001FEA59FC|nr:DUF417 family protein [Nocardia mexicana]